MSPSQENPPAEQSEYPTINIIYSIFFFRKRDQTKDASSRKGPLACHNLSDRSLAGVGAVTSTPHIPDSESCRSEGLSLFVLDELLPSSS